MENPAFFNHLVFWLSLAALVLSFGSLLLVLARRPGRGAARRLEHGAARRGLGHLLLFSASSFALMAYLAYLFYLGINLGPGWPRILAGQPWITLGGDLAIALRVWSLWLLASGHSARRRRIRAVSGAAIMGIVSAESLHTLALVLPSLSRIEAAAWSLHLAMEALVQLGYLGLVPAAWRLRRRGASQPWRRELRFIFLLHLAALPFNLAAQAIYFLTQGHFQYSYLTFTVLTLILSLGLIRLSLASLAAAPAGLAPGGGPAGARRAAAADTGPAPDLGAARTPAAEFARRHALSPREREVLDRLVALRKPEAIAGELFISVKTVNTHIASIYRKCAVRGRLELLGLVSAAPGHNPGNSGPPRPRT